MSICLTVLFVPLKELYAASLKIIKHKMDLEYLKFYKELSALTLYPMWRKKSLKRRKLGRIKNRKSPKSLRKRLNKNPLKRYRLKSKKRKLKNNLRLKKNKKR